MLESVITNASFYGFWLGIAFVILVISNNQICLDLGYWLQAHAESLQWKKERFTELKGVNHVKI